jgi:hypothetical protein
LCRDKSAVVVASSSHGELEFPLGAPDRIAYVANRVNQSKLAEFFLSRANERLNQLGIVFMRVLPEPNI